MQDAPDRQASDPPALSVVIPMYREAARIAPTLTDAIDTLTTLGLTSEIVLVDDGSGDGTVEAVGAFLTGTPSGGLLRVRLVSHAVNRGKGAAVRTGLGASVGVWRLIMDADNATRVREVSKLLRAVGPGVGLVAGSRCVADSDVEARGFRVFAGSLFKLGLVALGLRLCRDTQCGFKLYRRDVADAIVRNGVEDRFAFDIEHLLLARRMGVAVHEVGVRWRHVDGGTINPVVDGLRMLGRAAKIRFRRYEGLPDLRGSLDADRMVELKPASAVGV